MINIPELRALVAAATEGPWFARGRHLSLVPDSSGMGATLHTNHIGVMAGQDDAFFVAASRTVVPELLDRVEALGAALREAIKIAHEGWAIAHEGWGYAPAYFRDKWMDLERLAELKEQLAELKEQP